METLSTLHPSFVWEKKIVALSAEALSTQLRIFIPIHSHNGRTVSSASTEALLTFPVSIFFLRIASP